MNHLNDESPIERAGQGPRVREAKPGERIGRVPRVPHQEDIVLDEREQAGAGIEVVHGVQALSSVIATPITLVVVPWHLTILLARSNYHSCQFPRLLPQWRFAIRWKRRC